MHLKWQLVGQKYGVNMEDRNAFFKREMIKREMKENGNSAREERGTL